MARWHLERFLFVLCWLAAFTTGDAQTVYQRKVIIYYIGNVNQCWSTSSGFTGNSACPTVGVCYDYALNYAGTCDFGLLANEVNRLFSVPTRSQVGIEGQKFFLGLPSGTQAQRLSIQCSTISLYTSYSMAQFPPGYSYSFTPLWSGTDVAVASLYVNTWNSDTTNTRWSFPGYANSVFYPFVADAVFSNLAQYRLNNGIAGSLWLSAACTHEFYNNNPLKAAITTTQACPLSYQQLTDSNSQLTTSSMNCINNNAIFTAFNDIGSMIIACQDDGTYDLYVFSTKYCFDDGRAAPTVFKERRSGCSSFSMSYSYSMHVVCNADAFNTGIFNPTPAPTTPAPTTAVPTTSFPVDSRFVLYMKFFYDSLLECAPGTSSSEWVQITQGVCTYIPRLQQFLTAGCDQDGRVIKWNSLESSCDTTALYQSDHLTCSRTWFLSYSVVFDCRLTEQPSRSENFLLTSKYANVKLPTVFNSTTDNDGLSSLVFHRSRGQCVLKLVGRGDYCLFTSVPGSWPVNYTRTWCAFSSPYAYIQTKPDLEWYQRWFNYYPYFAFADTVSLRLQRSSNDGGGAPDTHQVLASFPLSILKQHRQANAPLNVYVSVQMGRCFLSYSAGDPNLAVRHYPQLPWWAENTDNILAQKIVKHSLTSGTDFQPFVYATWQQSNAQLGTQDTYVEMRAWTVLCATDFRACLILHADATLCLYTMSNETQRSNVFKKTVTDGLRDYIWCARPKHGLRIPEQNSLVVRLEDRGVLRVLEFDTGYVYWQSTSYSLTSNPVSPDYELTFDPDGKGIRITNDGKVVWTSRVDAYETNSAKQLQVSARCSLNPLGDPNNAVPYNYLCGFNKVLNWDNDVTNPESYNTWYLNKGYPMYRPPQNGIQLRFFDYSRGGALPIEMMIICPCIDANRCKYFNPEPGTFVRLLCERTIMNTASGPVTSSFFTPCGASNMFWVGVTIQHLYGEVPTYHTDEFKTYPLPTPPNYFDGAALTDKVYAINFPQFHRGFCECRSGVSFVFWGQQYGMYDGATCQRSCIAFDFLQASVATSNYASSIVCGGRGTVNDYIIAKADTCPNGFATNPAYSNNQCDMPVPRVYEAALPYSSNDIHSLLNRSCLHRECQTVLYKPVSITDFSYEEYFDCKTGYELVHTENPYLGYYREKVLNQGSQVPRDHLYLCAPIFCSPGVYGQFCAGQCPPCDLIMPRSICDDGRNGTGKCVCPPGMVLDDDGTGCVDGSDRCAVTLSAEYSRRATFDSCWFAPGVTYVPNVRVKVVDLSFWSSWPLATVVLNCTAQWPYMNPETPTHTFMCGLSDTYFYPNNIDFLTMLPAEQRVAFPSPTMVNGAFTLPKLCGGQGLIAARFKMSVHESFRSELIAAISQLPLTSQAVMNGITPEMLAESLLRQQGQLVTEDMSFTFFMSISTILGSVCECSSGAWFGEFCQHRCHDYVPGIQYCNHTTGQLVCTDDAVFNPVSKRCDPRNKICPEGWVGPMCSTKCPLCTSDKYCNAFGACVCRDPGSRKDPFTQQCQTIAKLCGNGCGGHGVCVMTDEFVEGCTCNSQFTGEFCEVPVGRTLSPYDTLYDCGTVWMDTQSRSLLTQYNLAKKLRPYNIRDTLMLQMFNSITYTSVDDYGDPILLPHWRNSTLAYATLPVFENQLKLLCLSSIDCVGYMITSLNKYVFLTEATNSFAWPHGQSTLPTYDGSRFILLNRTMGYDCSNEVLSAPSFAELIRTSEDAREYMYQYREDVAYLIPEYELNRFLSLALADWRSRGFLLRNNPTAQCRLSPTYKLASQRCIVTAGTCVEYCSGGATEPYRSPFFVPSGYCRDQTGPNGISPSCDCAYNTPNGDYQAGAEVAYCGIACESKKAAGCTNGIAAATPVCSSVGTCECAGQAYANNNLWMTSYATCSCPVPYTGQFCQTFQDDCGQLPYCSGFGQCLHVQLANQVTDSFYCSCPYSRNGTYCEIDSSSCVQPNTVAQCTRRGTCVSGACVCNTDPLKQNQPYVGAYCEVEACNVLRLRGYCLPVYDSNGIAQQNSQPRCYPAYDGTMCEVARCSQLIGTTKEYCACPTNSYQKTNYTFNVPVYTGSFITQQLTVCYSGCPLVNAVECGPQVALITGTTTFNRCTRNSMQGSTHPQTSSCVCGEGYVLKQQLDGSYVCKAACANGFTAGYTIQNWYSDYVCISGVCEFRGICYTPTLPPTTRPPTTVAPTTQTPTTAKPTTATPTTSFPTTAFPSSAFPTTAAVLATTAAAITTQPPTTTKVPTTTLPPASQASTTAAATTTTVTATPTTAAATTQIPTSKTATTKSSLSTKNATATADDAPVLSRAGIIGISATACVAIVLVSVIVLKMTSGGGGAAVPVSRVASAYQPVSATLAETPRSVPDVTTSKFG